MGRVKNSWTIRKNGPKLGPDGYRAEALSPDVLQVGHSGTERTRYRRPKGFRHQISGQPMPHGYGGQKICAQGATVSTHGGDKLFGPRPRLLCPVQSPTARDSAKTR